jgi:lysophospholipase L1-like esterase
MNKPHDSAQAFSGDGVHPNAGGSCFIAERILHAIEPILSEWTEEQ